MSLKKINECVGKCVHTCREIDGQNDKHSSQGAQKQPSLPQNWQQTKHRRRLLGNGWQTQMNKVEGTHGWPEKQSAGLKRERSGIQIL